MIKVFPFFRYSVIAVSLAVALTGCQPDETETNNAAAAQQPRAVAVDVIEINQQPLKLTTTLPGRTSAFRIAEVRPQVQGIITKRLFVEGSLVKKDDVLYQIDPATYEVALESAQANLASARATLERAELQLKRYENLLKRKAVSQQDYVDVEATYKEALAAVMSAEAQVKSARINLDYTSIKAPISGRIGRSFVSEGALVTASQTDYLARIQQLDPLYLDLSQSGNALVKMRQNTREQDEKLADIALSLDDGTQIEQEATLQFADVTVDEGTGTVNLRAIVPNVNRTLLPGMYIRAAVPTDFRDSAILVPQAAVTRDVTGHAHVLIVNADNKVEDRVIETSQVVNSQWLVESGLKAGEKVIVSGLQKVGAGSSVVANLTGSEE
jgi:membrane fusion protein (multidrug efflux system)